MNSWSIPDSWPPLPQGWEPELEALMNNYIDETNLESVKEKISAIDKRLKDRNSDRENLQADKRKFEAQKKRIDDCYKLRCTAEGLQLYVVDGKKYETPPEGTLRIALRHDFEPTEDDIDAHCEEALHYLHLTLVEGFVDVLYPSWGDRGLDLFILIKLLAEADGKPLPKPDSLWPLRGGFTKNLKSECVALGSSRSNVLIVAPSGCGKEAIAQMIHLASLRDGPFYPVSVPAIPESLFEAQAFGVRKGAATDVIDKKGFFQEVGSGTLFLDEVADLTLFSQAKLLRALSSKKARGLGDEEEYTIDCRILSATNKKNEIREPNQFRQDLRYRLEEHQLAAAEERKDWQKIKPLSLIREQLPLLTAIHLSRAVRRLLGFDFKVKEVTFEDRKKTRLDRKEALRATADEKLQWKGNHRELEEMSNNAVLRFVKEIAKTSDSIKPFDEWLKLLKKAANDEGITFYLKLASRHDQRTGEGITEQPLLPPIFLEQVKDYFLKSEDGKNWKDLQNAWFLQAQQRIFEFTDSVQISANKLGCDRSTAQRRKKRPSNLPKGDV